MRGLLGQPAQVQVEVDLLEYIGHTRTKAQKWQHRSHKPVPESAEESVGLARLGRLAATKSITVRRVAGEEFDRIIGYELGPIPEASGDADDAGDFDEEAMDFPSGPTRSLRGGARLMPNDLLTAALRHAELGYLVFPFAPPEEIPLTAHGFHNATVNPDKDRTLVGRGSSGQHRHRRRRPARARHQRLGQLLARYPEHVGTRLVEVTIASLDWIEA